MLNLKLPPMIGCPFCKFCWSLSQDEIERIQANFDNLNQTASCSRGHKFTYLEGITQHLISDIEFSDWSFISDIILYGVAEITIGRSHTVVLSQEVPRTDKVYLTCMEKLADISAIVESSNSFRIISSSIPNNAQVGENLKVSWSLYGRSEKVKIPTWQRLLEQSKEELLNQQYTLALLTCATAFESFIDTILLDLLTKKSIPTEASKDILRLESMRSLPDKVYKLLWHLGGIKFKECKEHGKWDKLLEERNKIAHGEVVEIPRDEAKSAFETIIRGILYILQNTKEEKNLFFDENKLPKKQG